MRRTFPRIIATTAACVFWSGVSNPQPQSPATFDAYVIDVEGGEATLFISPSGESMLVDTGWPGFDGRDADRIAAAAQHAGHHTGSTSWSSRTFTPTTWAARLLRRAFPFVDSSIMALSMKARVASRSFKGTPTTPNFFAAKACTPAAHPGDMIPISGLDVQVIAADRSRHAGRARGRWCAERAMRRLRPRRDRRSRVAPAMRKTCAFRRACPSPTVVSGRSSWAI